MLWRGWRDLFGVQMLTYLGEKDFHNLAERNPKELELNVRHRQAKRSRMQVQANFTTVVQSVLGGSSRVESATTLFFTALLVHYSFN